MSTYLEFKKALPIEYLKLQSKYSKLYGEKTLVLIQVGSFHEVYSTDNQGYNLKELGDLLGVVVTKKNKKEVSGIKNPYMIGFPLVATFKFINILIENNFTVVKIDQVTEPPKPKRQITGIYSPGTNIDNIKKPDSNNILSIFLEEIKQSKDNYLYATGLSVIDLSTGKSIIHEAYSNNKDKLYALDEINKFINYYLPKETIICFNTLRTKTEKDLIKYLELENKIFHIIDYNKEYNKISFQKQFLEVIFNNKSQLNIFDYLDLENINYARLSYLKLLNYCQEHISTIINNIEKPNIFIDNKNLYLGNNALLQLDILSNNKNKNCLDSILDYTKTSMGKRYLNQQIVSPLILEDEILDRYNKIDLLCQKQLYLKVNDILKNIHDTERLHRKLKLLALNPFEILVILDDYKNLLKLIYLFEENNIYNNFFSNDFKTNLINLIEYYNNLFDLDKIESISFSECKHSFYNKNIYTEIDEIQEEINSINIFIKLIEQKFSNLIEEKKKYFKEENEDNKFLVQLNNTEKEGLFLVTTKKRYEQIKKKFKTDFFLKIDNLSINEEDIQVKTQTNTVKIFIKQLTQISTKLNNIYDRIKPMLLNYYKKDLKKILDINNIFMNDIVTNLSFIDFINGGSNLAIFNNYCKPEIIDYEKSFLDTKNLRHPIIEQISDYAYVPHNICLGKDLNGILLYGVNSSGKSSLMKAIGISIIIAQIGYFVPADSFKYKPYESLITRISGNDNIFKGLSSYTLELYEIKNILKRINNKTLVIADEVCKGTEHNSALIIVMTLLETLNNNKSSFITATHLHELINFDRIKKLEKLNLSFYMLNMMKKKKINIRQILRKVMVKLNMD